MVNVWHSPLSVNLVWDRNNAWEDQCVSIKLVSKDLDIWSLSLSAMHLSDGSILNEWILSCRCSHWRKLQCTHTGIHKRQLFPFSTTFFTLLHSKIRKLKTSRIIYLISILIYEYIFSRFLSMAYVIISSSPVSNARLDLIFIPNFICCILRFRNNVLEEGNASIQSVRMDSIVLLDRYSSDQLR